MENIYEFQVFKKLKEKIVKNRDIRGQKKLFKQLILSFMPNLNISSEDEKYQKDKYLELLGILKSKNL